MCRPPEFVISSGTGALAGLTWQSQGQSQHDTGKSESSPDATDALPGGRFQSRDMGKSTFTAAQLTQRSQNSVAPPQAAVQLPHLHQQLQILQQKHQLEYFQQQQQLHKQHTQQQLQFLSHPNVAVAPMMMLDGFMHPSSVEESQSNVPGQMIGLEAWAKPHGMPGAASIAPRPAQGVVAPGYAWGFAPEMDGSYRAGAQGENEEEPEELDERKHKRMMSNRASAKRSRQRRQCRLEELEIQSAKLKMENATVQRRLKEANDQIRRFQEQNEKLERELKRLREDLEGCSSPGSMKPAESSLSSGSAGKPSATSSTHTESFTNVQGGDFVERTEKRKRDAEFVTILDEGIEEILLPGAAVAVKPEAILLDTQRNVETEKQDSAPLTPRELTGPAAADGNAPAGAAAGAAAGWEVMGRDMDIADGEFFASLIECFDGKPANAFLM